MKNIINIISFVSLKSKHGVGVPVFTEFNKQWMINPNNLGVLDNFVNLLPHKKVLDVGCWTGELYNHIKYLDLNMEYVGLDVSKDAIEFAKKMAPKARFYVKDMVEFSYEHQEEFDITFFLAVIEHLTKGSEGEFLKAIARVMKKGGHMIMLAPHYSLLAFLDAGWYFGHRRYRIHKLKSYCIEANLEIKNIWGIGGILASLNELKESFDKIILDRPKRHICFNRIRRSYHGGPLSCLNLAALFFTQKV